MRLRGGRLLRVNAPNSEPPSPPKLSPLKTPKTPGPKTTGGRARPGAAGARWHAGVRAQEPLSAC
eukprot:4835065-Prymnesium_polylepis.1